MCWKKGEFKQALEHLRKALDLTIGLKDLRLEGKVRIDMGMALGPTGELTAAERELREAILALEKVGDMGELARAYNNLGNMIMVSRNFDRAAQMFAKSKKLCERLGDLSNAAFGALNRAECLVELDKAPEALEELNMAYPIIERKGDNYALMAINDIFGLAYAKMKEWSRAEEHLLEARRLAQENSMPVAEAKILTDIGRLSKWRGNKQLATQYFKEAQKIFEKHGAKTDVQRVLEEMME
jgi:tetratricopeptide (TPR) repeat protein